MWLMNFLRPSMKVISTHLGWHHYFSLSLPSLPLVERWSCGSYTGLGLRRPRFSNQLSLTFGKCLNRSVSISHPISQNAVKINSLGSVRRSDIMGIRTIAKTINKHIVCVSPPPLLEKKSPIYPNTLPLKLLDFRKENWIWMDEEIFHWFSSV